MDIHGLALQYTNLVLGCLDIDSAGMPAPAGKESAQAMSFGVMAGYRPAADFTGGDNHGKKNMWILESWRVPWARHRDSELKGVI